MRTLAALPEDQLFATKNLSQWSTSEHLDHIARISLSMLRGMLRTDLAPLPKPINFLGRTILAIGWIPRGKGKAPEKFRGVRVPTETLLTTIGEVESVAATVDADELRARKIACIPHPRFGGLTPSEALRFIAVHNEHHLRIIRDILKTK